MFYIIVFIVKKGENMQPVKSNHVQVEAVINSFSGYKPEGVLTIQELFSKVVVNDFYGYETTSKFITKKQKEQILKTYSKYPNVMFVIK